MQRATVDGVDEHRRPLSTRAEEQQTTIVIAEHNGPVGLHVEPEESARGVGDHLHRAGLGVDGQQSSIRESGADASVGQHDDVFGRGSGQVDATKSAHGTFLSRD